MAKARVNYYEYIKSHAWKRRAKRIKEMARWHCEFCGRKGGRLETHHLTYDRLGRERDDDLCSLCDNCHEAWHAISGIPQDAMTAVIRLKMIFRLEKPKRRKSVVK